MRAPQHLDGPNVPGAGGAVPVTLATFPLLAGLTPVRRCSTSSTKTLGHLVWAVPILHRTWE
jgi:hypothetical protein